MIVTRKALPRRTFLRGMGATLTLPLLDAMIPSMTALLHGPKHRKLSMLFQDLIALAA